jgi:hypothetical protein
MCCHSMCVCVWGFLGVGVLCRAYVGQYLPCGQCCRCDAVGCGFGGRGGRFFVAPFLVVACVDASCHFKVCLCVCDPCAIPQGVRFFQFTNSTLETVTQIVDTALLFLPELINPGV